MPEKKYLKESIKLGERELTVETGRVDFLLADPLLARHASPARVWPTDKSDHDAVLADLEW